MADDTFRDQAVIITGASSGIGRALALRLAGQGAKVALAARRADRLDEVARQCRERGGQAVAIPTDVGVEEQCQALVAQTVAQFGRLDMLINNAGLAVTALLEELPDLRLFRHVIDVNFYGSVACTYYALPHLQQTRGRIVAISSLGGKLPIPYNTPYCASKSGLHGFFDALRIELTRSGVSVTVICPYWVVTEFHEAYMDKHGVPRGKAGRAIYTERMMSADRCAEIALRAAARRRREVMMSPGMLGTWLKLVAPGALDWLSVKAFLQPAIKRARAARQAQGEQSSPGAG
jgi:short-subunit dehydrogenase